MQQQRELIEEYTKKSDYRLLACNPDDDVDGNPDPKKRKGFSGVLKNIERGKVDTLIVVSDSIISNEKKYIDEVREILTDYGVKAILLSAFIRDSKAS